MAGLIYSKFGIGTLAAARANGLFSYNLRGVSLEISNQEIILDSDGTLLSTYSVPTVADDIVCVSTSSSDTGQTLLVQYLDANKDFKETLLTTNGTTPVLIPDSFRIFRAYIIAGASNTGNISLQIGTSTPVKMPAGTGITSSPVFTIPAGYRGFVNTSRASVSRNTEVMTYVRAKFTQGEAFNKLLTKILFASIYEEKLDPPLLAPEMTDIVLTAQRSSGAGVADCVQGMDLVLVPNAALGGGTL